MLTIVDPEALRPPIVDCWQSWLQTDANQVVDDGLMFGAVTDSIDGTVILDEEKKVLSVNQIIADHLIVDNRNGLTPHGTTQLNYSHSTTQSSSHSTSDSVKVGVGFDIKVKAEIFGSGTEATTKFSFDYTHSTTDTDTTQTSDTALTSVQATADVPEGKVYQVSLVVTIYELDVPYRMDVTLAGLSTIKFDRQVTSPHGEGTSDEWHNDIGGIMVGFANPKFMKKPTTLFFTDPDNHELGKTVGLTGVLKGQWSADFVLETWDITDTYQPSSGPGMGRARAAFRSEDGRIAPPPGAVLIDRRPVS